MKARIIFSEAFDDLIKTAEKCDCKIRYVDEDVIVTGELYDVELLVRQLYPDKKNLDRILRKCIKVQK